MASFFRPESTQLAELIESEYDGQRDVHEKMDPGDAAIRMQE